jgi:hypothetical protein
MPSLTPDRIRRDFLSAEQFMSCCDVVWSADRRKGLPAWKKPIPPGSLVYAKRDHADALFRRLSKTRSRVVMITSESDDPVETRHFEERPLQIGRWFSTNSRVPSVTALPLGLGNSYCPVTVKADAIAAVVESAPRPTRMLYVNFRAETNLAERGPLMDHFWRISRASVWVTVRQGGLSPVECLAEMAAHRFVLCPPGNGTDTHRMWEALYAGIIPVVQSHPSMDAFFDLPIIFVNDLLGLSPAFLEREYERIKGSIWNTEKLLMPWWKERLNIARARVQGRHSRLTWQVFLKEYIRSAMLKRGV